MISQIEVGILFAAHMRTKGMTENKAAEHYDVSRSWIQKIKRGDARPSQQMLDDLGLEFKSIETYQKKRKVKNESV